MSSVLPPADPLSSTRNCELAAILLSLGFAPVERSMTIASGIGIAEQGYWRFVQLHPTRAYLMHAVLRHGTRADLAAVRPAAGLPVYAEQAYMCAALHNRRMLVEHAMHGTPLRLEPCGYLHILQRTGTRSMPDHLAPAALAAFRACSVPSNDLAATLATLGFDPFAGGSQTISHNPTGTTWHFAPTAPGSSLTLAEVANLFHDHAWCGRPDNQHPVACCAAVLANLAHCRRAIHHSTHYVRAAANGRVAWLRRNAAEETWQQAEKFLTRNS
jgi:hypothetical protein